MTKNRGKVQNKNQDVLIDASSIIYKGKTTLDNMNDYSTEEKIVGTLDGKPLYRKTIEYTTPSSVQYPVINLSDYGITNIDKIYFASGSYSISSGRYIGCNSAQYINRYVDTAYWTITFINDGFASIKTVNVMEYTKTTDKK